MVDESCSEQISNLQNATGSSTDAQATSLDTPRPAENDDDIIVMFSDVAAREEVFLGRKKKFWNDPDCALSEKERANMAQGLYPAGFTRRKVEVCCKAGRKVYMIPSGLTPEQRAKIIMTTIKSPTMVPPELELVDLNNTTKFSDYNFWARPDQSNVLFMYSPAHEGQLLGVAFYDVSEDLPDIDWAVPFQSAAGRYNPDVLILSDREIQDRMEALLLSRTDPREKFPIPSGSFLTDRAYTEQIFGITSDKGQPYLIGGTLPTQAKEVLDRVRLEMAKIIPDYQRIRKTDENINRAVKRMHDKGVAVSGISADDLITILSCGFRGGSNKIIYHGTFPENLAHPDPAALTTAGGAWIQFTEEHVETIKFPRDPVNDHEYIDLKQIPAVLVATSAMKTEVLKGLQALEDQDFIHKGSTEYWKGKIKIPEEW